MVVCSYGDLREKLDALGYSDRPISSCPSTFYA